MTLSPFLCAAILANLVANAMYLPVIAWSACRETSDMPVKLV